MSKAKASEYFSTWGDVQKVLAGVEIRSPDRPSKLNPHMTEQQVFEVLHAGVKGLSPEEPIDWRSHRSLCAVNVWKQYIK